MGRGVRWIGVGALSAGLLACAGPGRTDRSERTATTQTGEILSDIERSALRERAIAMLEELSGDADPQVRANAIEGLTLAPARLAAVVPIALGDENAGVRGIAAMAMARAKLCDLAPLTEPLLFDASALVQIAAIHARASCGDSREVHRLGEFLLNDPAIRARAQAAFTLGELGNVSAMPLLRQAAARRTPAASDQEYRLFQLQIAEALAKLGDRSQVDTLHAALFVSRAEDLEATALAAQILGEIGSRSSEPDLVNLVAYRDEGGNQMPAEVRLSAGIALARLGREDADFIAREYLASESPLIRAQSAVLLGESGSAGGLGILRDLMDDGDPIVRVAACSGVLRSTSGRSGIRTR